MIKHTFFASREVKIFTLIALWLLSSTRATTQKQPPAPTHSPATANDKAANDKADGDLTFDTFLAADSYAIYGEVRSINQFNRAVIELMQPASQVDDKLSFVFAQEVFNISQLPFDFYKGHEKELEGARQMFANLAVRDGLPEAISAIEFATTEAAAKFADDYHKFTELRVKELNAKLSAAASKDKATSTNKPDDGKETSSTNALNVVIKRIGALVVFSSQPINFKALRPKDSLPLNANPSFQNARNRFAEDLFFIYYDQKLLSKKYEKTRVEMERAQAAEKKAEMERAANAVGQAVNEAQTTKNNPTPSAPTTASDVAMTSPTVTVENDEPPPAQNTTSSAKSSDVQTPNDESNKQSGETKNASVEVSGLIQSIIFSAGRGNRDSTLPEAISLGVKIKDDALDLRLLLVNNPSAPTSVIPYFFALPAGLPVTAEPPSLVPDDADIIIRTSIDATRLYETFIASSAPPTSDVMTEQTSSNKSAQSTAPQIAALEKLLGFSIKDDLLPSIGNEVVLMIPAREFLGSKAARPSAANKSKEESEQTGYAVFVTLNNADKIRTLIQRAGLFLGFNASEKYNDADISVSPNGVISVIDNTLIVAPDLTTMRHIVDSRRDARTVNSSLDFTTATAWQSRLTLMQVYVSKSLLKRYFDRERADLESFDPQMRDFLARFHREPAAITHTATGDGTNVMHEIHLPKNVLTTFIAQESVSSKTSSMRYKEELARNALRTVHGVERRYFDTHKRFATLQELTENRRDQSKNQNDETDLSEFLPSYYRNLLDYQLNLTITGDNFEATAIPKEYGKTGRRSYFIDKSGVLRGADHKGKPASADDPTIEQE